MAYSDHFILVDQVASHFDAAIKEAPPQIQSSYAGFFAVSSAAVLELALKEIIIGFAQRAHPIFGDYIASQYEQINGRIKLKLIKDIHLKPFGENYLDRFGRLISRVDSRGLKKLHVSVVSSYGVLIVCRNTYAHEGIVPPNTTYQDVKRGYEAGKVVMGCLDRVLR